MELNKSHDMYQIFISGYRLANVSHGKPYYVYAVEMVDSNNGFRYLVEKRYSEFNTLHRMLKKGCHTAPFPPKRVRNSNPKVLEQRRSALEIYMQKMLKLANTKQQVLNFLGIDDSASEMYHKGMLKIYKDEAIIQSGSLQHHPVLTFHCDPYVHVNQTTSLPDVVTNGVILGIYKS
ncbi:PREDICTED: sorting nexin-24-like [Ceratosolen solmsi marchali]|uniref:Sorting nexin-24-like n=1 Tax=Ceratosolen solmsi marchali TaxID=326594 RepID=A0AAJ7DUZ7_9HYME|nr:PREDICTED: sorting nexin-24-like [Ceratosolen solmsi marchali]